MHACLRKSRSICHCRQSAGHMWARVSRCVCARESFDQSHFHSKTSLVCVRARVRANHDEVVLAFLTSSQKELFQFLPWRNNALPPSPNKKASNKGPRRKKLRVVHDVPRAESAKLEKMRGWVAWQLTVDRPTDRPDHITLEVSKEPSQRLQRRLLQRSRRLLTSLSPSSMPTKK